MAEVAVLAEGDIAQEVVSKRIGAQDAHDRFSVGDVPFRLAHLLLVKKQPAVSKDRLG